VFTVAEVNGTWHNAEELPVPPADDAVNVHVDALSCPSAGNCGAGGLYDDTSGDRQAFVANEVHGAWQPLVEMLSTEFLSDENAEVLSVSCPSAGNCAIGGGYIDGSGHRQAYVGSERNGAWEAALELPALRPSTAAATRRSRRCPAPRPGTAREAVGHGDSADRQHRAVRLRPERGGQGELNALG
jgi:hypothetical protein